MASSRLPTLSPAEYTAEQREAAEAFRALRGTDVFGPFEALLHSPRLMTLAQSVGEYLRYHAGIGTTLSEFVILIVARAWSQDFEWHVHAPIAAKAGIRPALIEAVRDGRRPAAMSEDEATVYDFAAELLQNKRVSDVAWSRAEVRFGKPAVVDLVGICGYYTFLAMQMTPVATRRPARIHCRAFPTSPRL